jgi:hypothetical protein
MPPTSVARILKGSSLPADVEQIAHAKLVVSGLQSIGDQQVSGRGHGQRPSLDAQVDATSYLWEQTATTDEWLGMVATVSDHLRLGPQRLETLLAALRAVVDDLGGTLHVRRETHLLLARRT